MRQRRLAPRRRASTRRRRSACLAAALAIVAAIGWSPPAAGQQERAAPDSPAGFEYALPLDSVRQQAARPDGQLGREGGAGLREAVVAPLFGIGVGPLRSRESSPVAADGRSPDAGGQRQASRAPGAPGDDATAEVGRAAGGGGGIALPIGIALAVLAIGATIGLLLRRRPEWRARADRGLVLALAAGCGLAPLWHGFYALSAWGAIGLLLIAVLIGLSCTHRPMPGRIGLLALSGLGLLWVWALLSTRWAESADQALLAADRWLLYAVLFAVLLLVVRDDRGARLLVATGALATIAFAGYLCVRLASPGSADLFLGGRLEDPLGYVNGQAGHLLLALWPAVAVAEVARRPQVAGAALALAVILVGLMLLSQARAVALAGAIVAVLLLAVVPGRRRRSWCLLTLALGAALAAGPLLDVYGATSPGARRPDEAALRIAIFTLCAAAAVAGTVWGSLRWLADRPVAPRRRRRQRAVSGCALALVGLAVAAGVAVAVGDPAERARTGAREFRSLDVDATRESSSRFVSSGGNRYDYWRVAVGQFGERPLTGAGAGNYDVTYFAERRTREDVRQPHSLVLQVLAELGLVGLLGLLLLVTAPLIGFARRARRAGQDRDQRLLAVAAGGTFVAWLAHASVDWLHLIPGVTGIALCAAAALVVAPRSGVDPGPLARAARRTGDGVRSVRGRVAFAVAAIALTAGALSIAVPLVADRHTTAARQLLASDPLAALDSAHAALRLNDEALPAYYVAAAAHARRGDYRRARATLRTAIGREPRDFVSWGLLGDLAVRRGAVGEARAAYARAAQLNPLDRELRELARDPRSAPGIRRE